MLTKQAKLEKIIERALDNGWKERVFGDDIESIVADNYPPHGENDGHEKKVLFDKSFAKAIWREEKCKFDCGIENCAEAPGWEHHLTRAVISDDSIDYYYENM